MFIDAHESCEHIPAGTPVESAAMFNNAGRLIADAFAWGSTMAGVEGAVGVEFPLQLPPVR